MVIMGCPGWQKQHGGRIAKTVYPGATRAFFFFLTQMTRKKSHISRVPGGAIAKRFAKKN